MAVREVAVATTLIDLGELPPAAAGDGPPPSSGSAGRRAARGWPVVVLAIVLLLPGGAAAPAVPNLSAVAVLPYDRGGLFVAATDALYTLTRSTGDAGEFRAYRWTGTRRWSVRLRIAEAADIYPLGGLVLVSMFQPDADRAATTAFDAASGVARWQAPGRVYAELPGGRILLADQGVAVNRVPEPVDRYRAVAAGTGATAWTLDVWSASTVLPVIDDPNRRYVRTIAVVDPAGVTVVRDGRTGAVLASGRLPTPDPMYVPVAAVGGMLLVAAHRQLLAFGATDLRPRWAADLPGEPGSANVCGNLLCVGTSGGLAGVDPIDGQEMWTAALVDRAYGGSRRLVGYREWTARQQVPVVLSADTGRTLSQLVGWEVDRAGGPYVFGHELVTGRTWVGRLDLDTAQVRPLGYVEHTADACAAAGGYVACALLDGRLGVWRVRP